MNRLVADCELFAGLEPDALERLSQLGERLSVTAGTVLFQMGEDADRLFVVLRGKVLLTLPLQIHDTEKDLTVDEKRPPQLLGWSALVPPHRSTMSARAVEDSELYVFPRERLREAAFRDPRLGVQMMSNLAGVMARRFHQAQALWMRELQRGIDTHRY